MSDADLGVLDEPVKATQTIDRNYYFYCEHQPAGGICQCPKCPLAYAGETPVTYVGDKATNVITREGEIKSVNTPEVRAGMRGHKMFGDVPLVNPELTKLLRAVGPGGAPNRVSILPDDAAERKKYPIATGVLDYFPDALTEVSRVSYTGNEQHNPGQSLRWDRSKSKDEADTMIRHFMARGSRDSDGQRHTAKAAWRLLALLQKEIEEGKCA